MCFANCLGVNPNAVFRATRSNERPPTLILPNLRIDLGLGSPWRDEFPLSILRDKGVAIGHVDLDESVRQIEVARIPFFWSPTTVNEDRANEEKVRDSVPDGLVDEEREVSEMRKGRRLGRRLGLVRRKQREERRREEDGAMSVGFKVHANVVFFGGVVEMLDAGGDARDRKTLSASKGQGSE